MNDHTRRFRRRGGLALAAAAVMALALSACAPGGSGDDASETQAPVAGPCAGPAVTADGLKPVRIGMLWGLGSYAVQVAAEQGFFEEQGIEPEIPAGVVSTNRIPGLCNEYDVVAVTVPEIVEAHIRGAELGIISGFNVTTAENPSNPLVSSAETGPIESAEDMAGLTIGLNALTGAAADSVRWLLEEAGLGADAANLVVVPFPAMLDQVNAGLIDAAIMPPPFSTAALKAGLVAGIDPMAAAAGDPAATFNPMTASPGWVADNPGLAERFRAALADGMQWVYDNPEEALVGTAEWLDLPFPVVEGSVFPEMTTDITVEQVQAWITIMTDLGTITEDVDAEELMLVE